MKYSDIQRVEKISGTTQKLLNYLKDQQITQEMILEQEPLRWAITTPLYNIGEHGDASCERRTFTRRSTYHNLSKV